LAFHRIFAEMPLFVATTNYTIVYSQTQMTWALDTKGYQGYHKIRCLRAPLW